MECELAIRLMRARIDGELEPGLESEHAAHLSLCLPCRSVWEKDRRLVSLLREGAPPAGFRAAALDPERLLAISARRSFQEAALVRTLRRVAAAAALLIVSSGLLAGLGVARETRKTVSGSAAAGSSIKALAVSSTPARIDPLIDDDSSIMMALVAR